MESCSNEDETDVRHRSYRDEMRSKLSKMPFEKLKRLKERLGSKIYSEAMHGDKPPSKSIFKRANKNRPKEASSKIKPSTTVRTPKEPKFIDPRFNRLCGIFNRHQFQKRYAFLTDLRQKERNLLERMLSRETDEAKAEKLKYLIQRIDNQERERTKLQNEQERKKEERKQYIEALKNGKKPHFKTKYERKVVGLVEKYSELKKSGKVEDYINKKRSKTEMRENKKRRYFETIPED